MVWNSYLPEGGVYVTCKEEWLLRLHTFYSTPRVRTCLLASLFGVAFWGAALLPAWGYAAEPLPHKQKATPATVQAKPGQQTATPQKKQGTRSKVASKHTAKPNGFKADVFFPEGVPNYHSRGEAVLFGMAPSSSAVDLPAEGALAKVGKVVTVETAPDAPPFDPLSPRRGPLPGGGYAKDQPAALTPELSVKYSVGNRTSTRLSINNQNPSSPLFIPTDGPAQVESAGLFVDTQAKEDVEVHVGMEYKSIDERNPGNTPPIEDKGASFGVMWKF